MSGDGRKPAGEPRPLAVHEYQAGGLPAAQEFLKRTRAELRPLRMVCLWTDRLRVYDVNRDCFEIVGLGYPDPDVIPLLDSIGTAYDPNTIHPPAESEPKEFKTGRCHPWAEDRVM
jgi:hypothetical protein